MTRPRRDRSALGGCVFRVSSRGGSGLHQYWQTGAVMVAARAQVYLDQASTEWDESEVELEMTG